jgi:hypothetical protein
MWGQKASRAFILPSAVLKNTIRWLKTTKDLALLILIFFDGETGIQPQVNSSARLNKLSRAIG